MTRPTVMKKKLLYKRNHPPAGEPWVWLTRELLESDAWRGASINARRVVERLIIEHMQHAVLKTEGSSARITTSRTSVSLIGSLVRQSKMPPRVGLSTLPRGARHLPARIDGRAGMRSAGCPPTTALLLSIVGRDG